MASTHNDNDLQFGSDSPITATVVTYIAQNNVRVLFKVRNKKHLEYNLVFKFWIVLSSNWLSKKNTNQNSEYVEDENVANRAI